MEKKEQKFTMVQVPEDEQVKVIEMKLSTIFLGITGCLTLAGVAYTYYTHIKGRAEQKRIEVFAGSFSAVAKEIASVLTTRDLIGDEISSATNQVRTVAKSGKNHRKGAVA